jgi:hypothetical protein
MGNVQLDARHCSLHLDELEDWLQSVALSVIPKTGILRCKATVGKDRRRLDAHERSATNGEGAEVDEVKGREGASFGTGRRGGVHAHWGDEDAILEGQRANLDGLEEEGEVLFVRGKRQWTLTCGRGRGEGRQTW